MGSNEFGTLFKITTWGESHGQAIGAVIDGCPAGLTISVEEIDSALSVRAPGTSPYTSPRKEADRVEILSGVFEGKTTGAPISLLIKNRDADSSKYEPVKDLLRPGHANFTYLEKYGVFDYRGGGRASARETACRVAAGAVAKKLLAHYGIEVVAWLQQVGSIEAKTYKSESSRIFCPDPQTEQEMVALLEETKTEGDSVGGIVSFLIKNAPVGLGDPVYEKLEAKLASAMMSLPASKGFEIGEGFASVSMKGSQNNDLFCERKGEIRTESNHSGGTLGGISNGMPIYGRVVFKPASSIMKTQSTLTLEGKQANLSLPEGSRHDPCVAIRAVPVVEAMAALVIADALLMNRSAKL
ncbi:MAG: chorismate synthase [Parachlamydiaceae bacterium]